MGSGLDNLVRIIAASPTRFMWFLGAGASRTAGMPTADDLIWSLKIEIYCSEENQRIEDHDVSNRVVRSRVQSYFDGQGAPAAGLPSEYGYFFERAFGQDEVRQQQFLRDQLALSKVSLNQGHRVLASMMGIGAAKVVFSTNFDPVIEAAYAEMTGRPLNAFHLEGSYAALDALNGEQFPLYAKLHGDFQYRNVKNLPKDLAANDEQIQRCFLAAAARFGIVVTGYSGRDANVMHLFADALSQPNAFAAGLYWCVPSGNQPSNEVLNLIERASAAGIPAAVVEIGTFDILLSRLWRQLKNVPQESDAKVRAGAVALPSVPIPSPGKAYPLLRTNAFAVTGFPAQFGRALFDRALTRDELRAALPRIPESTIVLDDSGLRFFGRTDEIKEIASSVQPTCTAVISEPLPEPLQAISASTALKSLMEEGLAHALAADRPLLVRKRRQNWYLVASHRPDEKDRLRPIAKAVGGSRELAITGKLPRGEMSWAEALRVRLDVREGRAWLLVEPDIWISPAAKRDEAVDFVRQRTIRRWNRQANELMNAWVEVVFGSVGTGGEVSRTAYSDGEFPATFLLNTRSAFSLRG